MKRCLFLLLLGSTSLLLVAQSKPGKKEESLPALFKNAQYVDVEAYDGDALNPGVIPEDRNAIYNVEQGLKDWHRYSVVYERDRADLVFLVRKGRIATVTPSAGVDIGARNRNQSPPDPMRTTTGVGVDAEAGSPDDMLAVYFIDASGKLSGPIWEHSLKGGLDAPALPLFERVKHEVETAYP